MSSCAPIRCGLTDAVIEMRLCGVCNASQRALNYHLLHSILSFCRCVSFFSYVRHWKTANTVFATNAYEFVIIVSNNTTSFIKINLYYHSSYD